VTPRRDLARALYQADKELDRIHAPLVPKIGASVRKHAIDQKVTQEARVAILRDVDAMLDTIYPAKRGAPSKLQRLIEQRAQLAAMLPIADAVAVMRRHVPDDLRKRMGDEG
jgi:hypothetical protein